MTAVLFDITDEIHELSALTGLDLTSASQAQLDAAASQSLYAMGKIEAEIASREDARKQEHDIIDARYNREVGRLKERFAWHEISVKGYAERADFGKKKSRNVGFGTYGYRTKKGGLRVVDEAAAMAWAEGSYVNALRRTVKLSIDKKALDEYFAESGEEIPGTTVELDSVEWYATPEKP